MNARQEKPTLRCGLKLMRIATHQQAVQTRSIAGRAYARDLEALQPASSKQRIKQESKEAKCMEKLHLSASCIKQYQNQSPADINAWSDLKGSQEQLAKLDGHKRPQ